MNAIMCASIMAIAIVATGSAMADVPLAPVLGSETDAAGRPLPFGRAPYLPPQTPSGSGRYKALMAADSGLPAHVLYYPANLKAAGKLPVIAWGNGACINAGNRFRSFLTEIASHGYLVAANGIMADPELEVGPQENPRVRAVGEPPPAPNPNAVQRVPGRTTPEQLIESLDWAARANTDPSSPFFGHLDLSKIAVMGQSCGGVQAMGVAKDPRIKTMVIWSSGVGMIPNNPPDPQKVLDAIHTPVAFIHGDQAHDIAYPASVANTQAITSVPVFEGWQDGMTHIGTYGQANGGFFGQVAVAWLDWQLKSNMRAAKMFKGTDCTLCTAPSWHITKKNID